MSNLPIFMCIFVFSDADSNNKPPENNNNNNKVPGSGGESPSMESKSWFQRWNFKQENINTQNDQEKEKEFVYIINDRPLNSVKADLIHAFLSVCYVIND